jgi:hypothetical protein
MASHVAALRSYNLIDDIMATELSKPITDRSYTPRYLRTHPDYTGQQPPMLRMITAQRHQTARDKELERFVEDYEAGKIDQWGNSIAQQTTISVIEQVATEYSNGLVALVAGEEDIGTRKGSDSDSSQLTDLSELEKRLEASPVWSPADSMPKAKGSSLEPSITPSSAQPPLPVLPATSTSSKTRSKNPKTQVEPLEPSDDASDYSEFKYGELVAECRRRKILGGGCSQIVRNRLIQDDINMKQGLPRELISYKGRIRKHYKYEAPAALSGPVE